MLTRSMFKANDIRGTVTGASPEWDADGARAIGAAFVRVLGLAGGTFVLGRDMRTSGPELAAAFIDGATGQGADVIDVGLASTDQLWFASGHFSVPGVQLTASHNPSEYNGVKFCLADAAPIEPAQLVAIRKLAFDGDLSPAATPGTRTEADVLAAYAAHLHALVPMTGARRLRVVYDAGNGMAGHTAPAVLAPLNIDLIGLFTELDGSFPNHPPNPLEPQNLLDDFSQPEHDIIETPGTYQSDELLQAELSRIRQQAEQKGFAQGQARGVEEGKKQGHEAGFAQGHKEGFEQGLAEAGAQQRETGEHFARLLEEFKIALSNLDSVIPSRLVQLSLTAARSILGKNITCDNEHICSFMCYFI